METMSALGEKIRASGETIRYGRLFSWGISALDRGYYLWSVRLVMYDRESICIKKEILLTFCSFKMNVIRTVV